MLDVRFMYPRMVQQLAARTGTAFEMNDGERLQIIDSAGKQVCALVAFARDDRDEYLSTSYTRAALASIMLEPNAVLLSNRRNTFFTLEEDTVGRHDLLYPACDARRYRETYGLDDHANCRDNLVAALEPFGITADRLPDPVNLFMHATILRRGQLEVREPLSQANDYVVLRSRTALLVAVSACPEDQNPINGYNPTDLLIRVFPD